MGTIVVPRPGLKVTSKRSQITRMEIIPTGKAIKNQVPQEGCGDMMERATIFCGEAIGESIPPTLEASAMPRISALDIWESDGRFRSMGLQVLVLSLMGS